MGTLYLKKTGTKEKRLLSPAIDHVIIDSCIHVPEFIEVAFWAGQFAIDMSPSFTYISKS